MIAQETIKSAIAYRAAGLTLGVISEKLKVSQSCLKGLFKKFDVSRGSHRSALVKTAKELLIKDTTLASTIASAIAAAITNDLNLAAQIRENASLMLENLYNDSSTPTAQKSRSLAALATAASVAQSITFKALDIDRTRNAITDDDLPELSITGYSEDEMREIRLRADMTDLELSALDDGEEPDGN